MPDERDTPPTFIGPISRRSFLRTSSLLGGLTLVSCTSAERNVPVEQDISAPHRHPAPPEQTPVAGVYEFFTRSEARTVEAVAARLIPGDAQDPGAREAGVINYIDAKLARFDAFAEPTFRQPPFAEGFEGSPSEVSDDAVPVREDQLYRYGFQAQTTPQDTYRNGLPGLDRYAQRRFRAAFADLSEADQDAVLEVLDRVQQRSEAGAGGASPGGGGGGSGGGDEAPDGSAGAPEEDAAEADFGEVDPGEFFTTVRTDTIEGMFADPVYGGNRGLVGWTLIGFLGPQRSYSPEEMLRGTRRQPQSLDGLPPMNPDRRNPHAPEAVEQPRHGVREG